MSATAQKISDNYQRVRQRIDQAAVDAGRDPAEVKLVGVTKYVDAETARLLFDAGCQVLGESRPQALFDKAQTLADTGITWHLIGHLQRNKVARTLQCTDMIHSVDSFRLAQAINRIAGEQDKVVDVLLEINVSAEPAKHGFQPDEMPDLIGEIAELPNIQLQGLMCMAGLSAEARQIREQFAMLRQLRDRLQCVLPDRHPFSELSMGMSGDFEMAIAEGATIVRIGSVLFEGVI